MGERPLLQAARQICAEDPDCRDPIDAVRTLTLIAFASALGQVSQLQRSLCLKGGTLLRMLNQGQIGRMPSMDLDASILHADFSPDLVETVAVDELGKLLHQRFQGELRVDVRYQHPLDTAQQRPGDSHLHIFRLSASAAINPSQPNKRSRIDAAKFCFEATEDEWIDRSLLTTLNNHYYGFPLNLCAYAPLQSMAEKLRALLQKLAYYERGVQQDGKAADDPGLLGNFIGRHVVDLEILHRLASPYEHLELRRVFHAKCDAKAHLPLALRTAERLQHPRLLETVRREYPQRAATALKLLAELATIVTAPEE